MSKPDRILRNARAVLPDRVRTLDIAVHDGRIAALGRVRENCAREQDLRGALVLPGFIDPHVHFNEPGRTAWEGFSSGSRAFAAAGGTCFFDMPLNSHPPLLDAQAFRAKKQRGVAKSFTDFCLWGGITPGNLRALPVLAELGVIGFKAFLCDSGIPEFPATDWKTLRRAMDVCAGLGLPVAVHAEDPAVLRRHAARFADGTPAGFAASRPVAAEVSAVERACEIAAATGARLHIVHASCSEVVHVVRQARKSGVDVTVETCSHYLLFDSTALPTCGGPAKCAPPLRSPQAVSDLWGEVRSGTIDFLASDHSPAPRKMKTRGPFNKLWGGIAGCQHAFPAAISRFMEAPRPDFVLLAKLLASHAAERFAISHRKGAIREGLDADLVVLRETPPRPIRREDLLYRHKISLYEGVATTWEADRVFLRGNPIGKSPCGEWIAPKWC